MVIIIIINTARVVAREFLVPGGICGNFCKIDNFIEKLPKFGQIKCDFAIFDIWVLGARA